MRLNNWVQTYPLHVRPMLQWDSSEALHDSSGNTYFVICVYSKLLFLHGRRDSVVSSYDHLLQLVITSTGSDSITQNDALGKLPLEKRYTVLRGKATQWPRYAPIWWTLWPPSISTPI